MFSKACEYALKTAIYIAQQTGQGRRVNVKEAATAVDAPEAFTAKLLQQLCRENILTSTRGKQGGFLFDVEKQKSITIYEVVVLIDGPGIFTKCCLGLHRCSSENPCPVHNEFKVIREGLTQLVKEHTFYDLAQKTESGLAWLK